MSEIHLVIEDLKEGCFFASGDKVFIEVVEHYLNLEKIDYLITVDHLDNGDTIYTISLD